MEGARSYIAVKEEFAGAIGFGTQRVWRQVPGNGHPKPPGARLSVEPRTRLSESKRGDNRLERCDMTPAAYVAEPANGTNLRYRALIRLAEAIRSQPDPS